MTRIAQVLIRTIAPILLALSVAGAIIFLMGADPLHFYTEVLRLGLLGQGWQQSLTVMAPLLLVALGLIIAFRAQLWNLGYGGAYLLSAAITAGIAPHMFTTLPFAVAIVTLLLLSLVIGGLVGLAPALLKAWRGTNEVITSLMMSFIAMGLASLLIRGPLKDPGISIPQTRVLPLEHMLPFIPGTQVHVGLVLALVLTGVAHLVLTRSSIGLKIDMYGASPRAAQHAGVNVKLLVVTVFLVSSGAIALAGAIDMLGLWGYARAEWNPGYGDKILPFVFLARLSPLGAVPLVAFYAVLATGGTIAAQRAGLSVDVLLVIVSLILVFMLIIEYLGARRARGASGASLFGRSYLRRISFGSGEVQQ